MAWSGHATVVMLLVVSVAQGRLSLNIFTHLNLTTRLSPASSLPFLVGVEPLVSDYGLFHGFLYSYPSKAHPSDSSSQSTFIKQLIS